MTPSRQLGVAALLAGALVTLGCWISPATASAAAGASRLSVEYRDHALTVDAQGVPLSQVLSQIGSSVGFTVVDNVGSVAPVNVSIQSSSVEDALRQLLRGENHTVIYRASEGGAAGIESIVLLGEPGRTKHPEEPQNIRQAGARQEAPSLSPSNPTAPLAGPTSPVAETAPFVPGERPTFADAPADPGNGPATVQDMLKANAMAGLPSITGGTGAQASGVPAPAASSAPVNPEAALAETTRRAQESLSTLMSQLSAATRSLQASGAIGRK